MVAAKSNAEQEAAIQLASGFATLTQDMTSAINGQSWHFRYQSMHRREKWPRSHYIQILLPARHEKREVLASPCQPVLLLDGPGVPLSFQAWQK